MQALFDLTEGRGKLEALIKSFPSDSPHWKEAQNRFQFVDSLLTECLGWEKPDIEVEMFDDLGGRSDYCLGRPIRAVLEAKREAKLFEIPPTGNPTAAQKIKPLLHTSKYFKEAVHQVIPYCAMHGAQIAIICNGPQLAIFQAIIPGLSPLEGDCFFFNGFDSYLEYFPLLWKLLSPEGIAENSAYYELYLHRNPRIPQKASTSISEPQKYRYRSKFQEDLRYVSEVLLEEVEDNPKLKTFFYKDCYVAINANNRNLLISKSIIASRYRRAGVEGVAPSTLEATTVLECETGSRPFVVVGDVGVGKTSFFENLYNSLDADEKSNTIFIHLNLGLKANLVDDIKSFVLSEIPDVLYTKYDIDINSTEFVNTIYYRDLSRFDKGPKGALKGVDENAYCKARIDFLDAMISKQDRHLQAALGHLSRGQNKQIVLVLDNADQRSFKTQQEAFLIAQEIASSRNLLVFVSLRPSTFYLSKTTGALSAYQNKVFTISPPPADDVIKKRLIFAARVAEGKVAPINLPKVHLKLESVVKFINATLRSIHDCEPIKLFLSNITGGNTRAVIELITGFFGSPNVDSEKIVQIEGESGNYKIPLHEFAKHALLGEYAYFNAQSSLLAYNIFDVSAADPREHFLASLVVAYLNSNSIVLDIDGFINGQEVIKEMQCHGFVEEQTRNALRRLATKRLIETPYAHYREISVASNVFPETLHFRITTVGVYHILHWTGSFAFLDAVSIDTPIFDEKLRDTISKLASSFDIEDRYNRASCFKLYLKSQWHSSGIVAKYYNFASLIKAQEQTFLDVKKFLNTKSKQKPSR